MDGPEHDREKRYVLIVHEVEDYPKWKQVFDAAAGIRREAGEIEYQLFALDRDARQIVHLSRWTSLDAARDFFESPRLAEIRREAGVVAPEFRYLEQLEAGTLDCEDPQGGADVICTADGATLPPLS